MAYLHAFMPLNPTDENDDQIKVTLAHTLVNVFADAPHHTDDNGAVNKTVVAREQRLDQWHNAMTRIMLHRMNELRALTDYDTAFSLVTHKQLIAVEDASNLLISDKELSPPTHQLNGVEPRNGAHVLKRKLDTFITANASDSHQRAALTAHKRLNADGDVGSLNRAANQVLSSTAMSDIDNASLLEEVDEERLLMDELKAKMAALEAAMIHSS